MFSKRFLALAIAAIVLVGGWQGVNAETLEEILKEHVQALGGEEALKGITSSEAEFEITVPGGLTGTQKSYFKYPNKLRSETDLKVVRGLSVYNGQKGWVLDPNGQVRELAGQELEGIATDLYFDLYGYLFPERAKGKVEYLGREQSEGVNYHVLEVKPEGVDPVKLYINPETYLIDKSVWKSDVVEVTTYYQDYKDFQGIKMAGSVRVSTGDTTYDVSTRLIYAEFNPPLSEDLFKAPVASAVYADSASGEEQVLLSEIRCVDKRKPRYDYFSYTEATDSTASRTLLVFSFAIQGDIATQPGHCIHRYTGFGNPAKIVSFAEGGMEGSYLLIGPDPSGAAWSRLPDLSGVEFTQVIGIISVDWDAVGGIAAIHVGRPMGMNETMSDYIPSLSQGSVRCYRIQY